MSIVHAMPFDTSGIFEATEGWGESASNELKVPALNEEKPISGVDAAGGVVGNDCFEDWA